MNQNSISNISSGFSERLQKRCHKKDLSDAVDLAIALSENRTLRELIQPKSTDKSSSDNNSKSNNKYKSRKKPSSLGATQYNTILRYVQNHWKTSDPQKIPHKYIIAYSLLLDCSTDYLYGLSSIETANMADKEICEKTGITEEALYNLRSVTLSYFDRKYGITASIKGSKPYITSQLLASPLFTELIDSLHTIDYYISRDAFLNSEKEKTLSLNCISNSSNCGDAHSSEPEYDEEAENAFFVLQEKIDANFISVRTARYESQELYMMLLDEIFPKLKDFSIKIR